MSTVAVALSGGVDSAVAALVMKEGGDEVLGLTMRLWTVPEGEVEGGCCTLDDVYDARAIARALDIRHYVIDETKEFRDAVVQPFFQDYQKGRTPSPCIQCNNVLKFERLVRLARNAGADRLATGHYARIDGPPGRRRLLAGHDPARDQSYFLFGISSEVLDYLVFPVGDLPKSEVRARAFDAKIPVARKPDSQDLCFLAGTNVRDFLVSEGAELERGEIVDTSGAVVGQHDGIFQFTIGQRKGLGIASGRPMYVVDIVPEENRVILGSSEDLLRQELVARACRWLRMPSKGAQVQVRIRHRAPAAPATIEDISRTTMKVHFDEAVRAITPGQAAVVYDGDEVLGGGWIERSPR